MDLRTLLFALAVCAACAPPAPVDPSDDPDDWEVDASVDYEAFLGAPRFVVPSDALPVATLTSNNNVGITFHEGRLFLAWRTSPTHFASDLTRMHVISSGDGGVTWEHETTVQLGSDVREPQLLTVQGKLRLTFFEAGTNPFAFEPRGMWRSERGEDGTWTAPEQWGEREDEVPWELKLRGGRAWMSSYTGNHYGSGESAIAVHVKASDDGLAFSDVAPAAYVGGASEAGFELDADGSLWAVLRNEDGDGSGFGSLVCHAPAEDLASWDCPSESDPERYDSPRMFRHGDDLYLIARRDIGGPFDQGLDELSISERRQVYAAAYWDRPKRTALYRIDKEARRVVHVVDLPSSGDTAFASIRRTGAHSFLVANYTSPVEDEDRTWLEGQGAIDGTSIYLIDLVFAPR